MTSPRIFWRLGNGCGTPPVLLASRGIYASHKSIMFSRTSCYFFVRPQAKFLEVCFFLGRTLKHPLVRKSCQSSKLKVGHILRVTHRDEVEVPITGWLKEAYDVSENLRPTPKGKARAKAPKRTVRKPALRKTKARN